MLNKSGASEYLAVPCGATHEISGTVNPRESPWPLNEMDPGTHQNYSVTTTGVEPSILRALSCGFVMYASRKAHVIRHFSRYRKWCFDMRQTLLYEEGRNTSRDVIRGTGEVFINHPP